ncbi:MAG: glycoside hydrolase family 9 protein [Uliginosibacterium sp.]|nr:glycoside hydrolase family 9 protein [Uliginosibacterium sp.]
MKDPHSDLDKNSSRPLAIPADTCTPLGQCRQHRRPRPRSANVSSSAPYKTHAKDLARDALHFFYAQRAGQAIKDGRYDTYRNQFDRKAGHQVELAKCFDGLPYIKRLEEFQGKDLQGDDFSNACPPGMPARDVHGGWYDAGDYGKYVVNAAASLWSLQNVIEIKQKEGD